MTRVKVATRVVDLGDNCGAEALQHLLIAGLAEIPICEYLETI